MVRGRTLALFAPARAAACVALIALAACAPELAMRGAVTDTPTIESEAFVTRDGLRLPLRHWDADRPRAVIIALHGMSDYSEAFDLPGPYWAAHGITTYAYDQRGFGRAPDPGVWAGAAAMRNDLGDIADAARAKYPGIPVYALGESMGGAVVLSALAGVHPPHVDGAILVAPAAWSRDDMPFYYGAALWLAAHIAPGWHLSGNGLHIVACDNIAVLRKLSRDPLYQHSARADQVYGLVNLMDDARRAPEHFSDPRPILLLYGAKDQVIPAMPTQAVIKELGARAEVRRDESGYHMLLRDLDGESQWKIISDWVSQNRGNAAERAHR